MATEKTMKAQGLWDYRNDCPRAPSQPAPLHAAQQPLRCPKCGWRPCRCHQADQPAGEPGVPGDIGFSDPPGAVGEPDAWMVSKEGGIRLYFDTEEQARRKTLPGYKCEPLYRLRAAPAPLPAGEPDAAELEMAVGYVLDNEPPKTLAGCHERIRNMQDVIRRLIRAAPAAPPNGAILAEASELARQIHETVKRGKETHSHGLIGNLRCVLDHLVEGNSDEPR